MEQNEYEIGDIFISSDGNKFKWDEVQGKYQLVEVLDSE